MRACRLLRRLLPSAKGILLKSRPGECGHSTEDCLLRFRQSSFIVAHSYSANILQSVVGAVGKGWGAQLKQLDLRSNIIADSVTLLASALPACTTLQELNLEHNSLGDDGVEVLASALPECSALVSLLLGDNSIGKHGMTQLARALSRCPCLRTLELGGNRIEDDGLRSLAEVLPQCASLALLNVGRNGLKNGSVAALAQALPRAPSLCALGLARNYGLSAGLTALEADAQARNALSAVTALDLSTTGMGHADAAQLASSLACCLGLASLKLQVISRVNSVWENREKEY